ncbi:MAG: FtsW/RodA/SpoVE family cell cycle protein [Phycisphaerae bacterium]|nr:FtsW/RodA/SpoVE family cell cycle protein [Phycisphaerae bacterium]
MTVRPTQASDDTRLDAAAPAYDGPIVFLVGLLMMIGAAMVVSSSVSLQRAAWNWNDLLQPPMRQCLFAIAGLVALFVGAHIDYRVLAWREDHDGWKPVALWLVAFGLLVAMYTPGIGHSGGGALRGVTVIPGVLTFQPGEVAKLVLVVYMAALLTSPVFDLSRFWRGFMFLVASAGLVIGLIAKEDFGTGALLAVIMVVMLVVARAKWRHLAFLVLLGVAATAAFILNWLIGPPRWAALPLMAAPIAVLGVVRLLRRVSWSQLGVVAMLAVSAMAGFEMYKEYRVQRIETWVFGTPDPQGDGYQINQAMLAIGSGGWWGRGLGAGVQKYGFLPQANNDFILAIICEELGIAGGLAIVTLFVLLLARGWWLSRRAGDAFGKLLALGLTITITLQAAFNVGVVTNSVPTKGISLPFVSAGGSGVLFLGLAAGLLASVRRGSAKPATTV